MTFIPKGIPHESVGLNLGEKRMELTVARMGPTGRNMSADAFIDFGRNTMVGKDNHVIADRTPLGCHHYIGAINLPIAAEDFSPTVRNVVFTALRNADEFQMSSAWINLGSSLADLCPGSVIDAYTAVLDGVKQYADYVEKNTPEVHVSDIIIGVGSMMYGALHAFSEVGGGFFPATIFPATMVTPAVW